MDFLHFGITGRACRYRTKASPSCWGARRCLQMPGARISFAWGCVQMLGEKVAFRSCLRCSVGLSNCFSFASFFLRASGRSSWLRKRVCICTEPTAATNNSKNNTHKKEHIKQTQSTHPNVMHNPSRSVIAPTGEVCWREGQRILLGGSGPYKKHDRNTILSDLYKKSLIKCNSPTSFQK